MTATRSRPDPKVEAAEMKQELAGSERISTDNYTPGGMGVARFTTPQVAEVISS